MVTQTFRASLIRGNEVSLLKHASGPHPRAILYRNTYSMLVHRKGNFELCVDLTMLRFDCK